jgi:gliding motility-associated-like protein
MLKHLNYLKNLLDPEMPAHAVRWNNTYVKWLGNVDTIASFIKKRCALVGSGNDTCMAVQKIVFNVDAVGMGNIVLGGTNTLTAYPYRTVTPASDTIYDIKAVPLPGFRFVKWVKSKPENIITPTITSASAFLNFKKEDSITAVFEVIPPDTFAIKVNAMAPWAGVVVVNGTDTVKKGNFIKTYKWLEYSNHTLLAIPDTNHTFAGWYQANGTANTASPNLKSAALAYSITKGNDSLVARFDTIIKVYINPIFLPNAFTPNGDGSNDVFGVNLTKNPNPFLTEAILQVFDRFGNRVYNGNALNAGWDGNYLGEACKGNTYFYELKAFFMNGEARVLRGDVTLVR